MRLEEATTRLQRDIAAPQWRAYENRQQPFVGTFADGRFHMMRLVTGKNSFRPMIDGQVSPAVNGCRVDVRLKLPAVAVFASVLFVVIGMMISAAALSRVIATGDLSTGYFAIVGLAMLAIALVVPTVEARKAARLLATLFRAQPSEAIP